MSTELLIDVPYGQQKPPYGTQLNKSWVQKYNPSLVLPFNESAGNIVYDISGNQNNGVFNNGPIWQQSNNGSAIFLNGQTVNPQQISVPNSPTLNPSSVTVSVWFCTTNGGPLVHNVILAKTYKFFNLIYQYEIEMNNSGRIAASIRNSSNGVVTSLTTGVNNYSDGRWHNAIISYSSIANTLFLMIDGIVLASSSGFTSVMATDGLFPLIIGNSGQSTQSSGNGPFSGMVANVVILPYSLTIQQAQKLYYNPYEMFSQPSPRKHFIISDPSTKPAVQLGELKLSKWNQKPPYGTKLNNIWKQNYKPVLFLSFNEPAGNIAYDISDNQNNGVLSNVGAINIYGLQPKVGYATVANSPSISVGTNNFSLAVRFQTTIANCNLLDKRVVGGAQTGYCIILASGHVQFQLNDASAAHGFAPSSQILNDGNVHSLVLSVSRNTNIAKLYCDGMLSVTANISAVSGSISSNVPLNIGASNQNTGQPTGIIYYAVIFSGAITAQQAQELSNNSYNMFNEPAPMHGFYYVPGTSLLINLTSKVLTESYSSAQKTIARILSARNLSTSNLLATKSIKQNINSQAISQTENQSQEHVQRKLSSQVIVNSGFVKSSFNLLLVFASKVLSISYSLAKLTFSGRKFQLLSFRRTSQQAINQGEATPEDSGQ